MFWEEFESVPPKKDPKYVKRRNEMSKNAKERARKLSSNLKNDVQRRIAFEESDSSSIGNE